MKKSLRGKKVSSVIVIKNLSVAQSIALEDMLATWQGLGHAGASRWTSFFADGDGDFRPEISYNGEVPQLTKLLDEDEKWQGSDYKIDFDSIGWKLHDHEEMRALEIKKHNLFWVFLKTIRFFIVWAIEDLVLQIKLYKIRKRSKKCSKQPTISEACESPSEDTSRPATDMSSEK